MQNKWPMSGSGAVGKTAERARYIQLMNKGWTNEQICHKIGVNAHGYALALRPSDN